MGSARAVVENRAIVRSEASWGLAALGTWVFAISLALYSYYEHGPVGVGLAVAARMLPAAALAGLGARMRRRWSGRATATASALLRFLALETVALVVWVDAPFALLLALGAAFEVAAGLHRGVRGDLVLQYARAPTDLLALSLGRVVTYGGFLLGALLSGLLLTTVSFQAAFAVSGLVFALAAALVWRLPMGSPGPARCTAGSPGGLEAAGAAVPRLGPGAVAHEGWSRLRLGLFGAEAVVQATLDLLLVVVALELVHLGDGGVGWLRSAFACGGVVAAAGSVSWLRGGRLAAGVVTGLLLAGIPLAIVVGWSTTGSALALVGLLGTGYALMECALQLLTDRLIPPAPAAEAVRLEKYVYPLMRAAGAGLGTWLVLGLGDRTAVLVAGLLLPVAAVVAFRPLRSAEGLARAGTEAAELIRQVPAVAGLPRAAIEDLARRAGSQSFDAGTVLLDRTRPPDALYVIRAGRARASGDDGPAVVLERGAWFGQSAILGPDGEPSAVTAVTPVTAWTVTLSDVIGSLGGPPADARRIPPAPGS